jgi:hypothetical protein
VLEGGEGVAGSLLGIDVVLLVLLIGVAGLCSAGRRRGRAAVELELAGAAGDGARMRENKVGLVNELQGVAAVL